MWDDNLRFLRNIPSVLFALLVMLLIEEEEEERLFGKINVH